MSRIKKQILNKLKEYANKMGRDHLGGDDYTSKKKGGLRDFDGYDNVDYNKDMPMDESVNEGPIDRVIGGRRYKYVGDGRKGKAIVSGPIKDKDKNDIIKRAKKAGYIAKPNMGGGVTIFIESVNEASSKYPNFDLDKNIRYQSTSISSGMWRYTGKEQGGKGVYRNLNNGQFLGFASDDFKYFKKHLKKHFDIDESVNESMFSLIDQIRQDSKNVRDFVKNVFKDRDFKKMSNDKEFIKYLKSIYEGVDESKGVPSNYMQGRTSDYHTALRGKNRDYSGGTNFKKKNHGQPDVEEEDEDQETNHLSNKQTHIKSDKLKVSEGFDKIEHLSLLNKALKAIPGSQKQKEIIRKLNVVRKAGGMRPLKEQSIVEYGQRLDLSFIEDEEARLDGTPKPKDAIDRDIDESLNSDISNAKKLLKDPHTIKDIEYRKTRRGDKFVKIIYTKDYVRGKMMDTGPHFVSVFYNDEKELQKIGKALKLKLKESVSETAKRDYKDEYKKFQSSTKSKKYRAELNKYNRQKGTYGNGDGKDASHKGGKIVGFESASKNRGRKEKSRLKKK